MSILDFENENEDRQLNDGLADFVTHRLLSHYGLHQEVVFRGNWGGSCSPYRLRLGHTPSVGTIAHEVAHGIQWRKKRHGVRGAPKRRWHTKQHKRLTSKVQAYIMKKLPAWEQEYKQQNADRLTRLAHRVEKLETQATLKSSPQYKLDRLIEQRKCWQTKLKRAQTAIKRLNRRIGIWERKVGSQTE